MVRTARTPWANPPLLWNQRRPASASMTVKRSVARGRSTTLFPDTRSSVSRSLLLRLLENFFRRWYLYLIPIVLLAALGVMQVSGKKKAFQSVGTFNVESSTVLSSLSGQTDQNFGWDTPAGATSKRIGSMFQTDQFIK